MLMEIIYEDSSVAVCFKPPFVSSQSVPDGKDMVSLLTERCGTEIFPVHRLDTLTSGVMVYAKTASAAASLSREMQNGGFGKEYIAVVHGRPPEDSGTFEDLLFFDRSRNKSFVVKRERGGVKKASLEYRVIESRETEKGLFSLVRIKLHTGRTHQIRVQFASRGMPVRGDGKYGSKFNSGEIALLSDTVSFTHPETGEKMCFSSGRELVI